MTIFLQFQCHTKSPFKHTFEQCIQRAMNLHFVEEAQCAGEDGKQQTRKEPQTPPLHWDRLGTRATAIWSNIRAKTGHSPRKMHTQNPFIRNKDPERQEQSLEVWLWQTELIHPALRRLSAKPEQSSKYFCSCCDSLCSEQPPKLYRKVPKT